MTFGDDCFWGTFLVAFRRRVVFTCQKMIGARECCNPTNQISPEEARLKLFFTCDWIIGDGNIANLWDVAQ